MAFYKLNTLKSKDESAEAYGVNMVRHDLYLLDIYGHSHGLSH
jgi:hypothetical protein